MLSPRHETGPPDLTTPGGFGAFYEEHIDAVLGFVTRRVVPTGHTLALSWAYYPPYRDGKQGPVFAVLRNEYAPCCFTDNTAAALEAQRLGPRTPPPGMTPPPPPGVPPTPSR
ncbi:hypothetical protein [Streptomyces sp. NPDC090022]|uniref:hypothetical protein n=1 Tax=Streptomyces sp. NPDC090022 TaxID=3365920 RepID=UPI0038051D9A